MTHNELIEDLVVEGLNIFNASNLTQLLNELGPKELLLSLNSLFVLLGEHNYDGNSAIWHAVGDDLLDIVDTHVNDEQEDD